MALIDKLTAIADAIRGKTGKTDEMTLDQMVTEIEGIQTGGGGGDTAMEDGLIDGTVTHYENDRVTIISRVFNSNTTILSISLPNVVKSVGANIFNGCNKLQEINLPKLEQMGGGNDFRDCKALKRAVFPRHILCGTTFLNCTSLEYLDAGAEVKESEYSSMQTMFNVSGCTALKTIVLRYNKVVSLNNVSIFNNSPFASGGTGGVLLIPSALVESYKTATNWSVIYGYGHNRFLALEDYTVDGSITGEIDRDKVNALFE